MRRLYRNAAPVFRRALRWIARGLILVIGLLLAELITDFIFPALDNRTPFVVALLITYALTAYGLLPLTIRLINWFRRPKHVIPRYNVTGDGLPCDPVNIGVIGTRAQLERAFHEAGWSTADRPTLINFFKMAAAVLLKRPYPTAPFSNLYLFGRHQDIGFQKQPYNHPRERHHVRFWALSDEVDPDFMHHLLFWRERIGDLRGKKLLWIGAATYDDGLTLHRSHGQIDHSIASDSDREREIIARDLRATGRVREVATVSAGEPYTGKTSGLGNVVRADGDLKIVTVQ